MFLVADVPAAAELPPAIVVTASRTPQPRGETAASVTVIDATRTGRLGEPLLSPLLRLAPSAALSSSGPAGSQVQLRVRGAEANHTLLFIDGIRANDPAAGNEPRFELLSAELTDRIELVRGPQSALWGSEAIGGVVALTSRPTNGASGSLEAGSHHFGRASVRAGTSGDRWDAALLGGVQRSSGIDSFAGDGERDGYRNLAVRSRLAFRPSAGLELSASGFAVRAQSEFDGYDPQSFARADTGDETRNRLAAGRLGLAWQGGGWAVKAGVSHLFSANRNSLDGEFLNRTEGRRSTGQLQVERRLTALGADHLLIAAAEFDREGFRAADEVYYGATDQQRSRRHLALTGEWRADWGALITDFAVRRDRFSSFRDATTLRASALLPLDERWSVAASYGEGIAQPTFFDLYGFFPGSFVGNPGLQPERSRGGEASLRYSSGAWRAAATMHRQRLRHEIIDVFLPLFRSTTANATGTSTRSGVELESEWSPSPALRVGINYAWLKAGQRQDASDRPVRELRRPRHSGSVVVDGEIGRWSYGAALAITGDRRDTDFDRFPPVDVTLRSAWLLSGRLSFRVTDRLQLFARVANGLNDRYQDVFGYRTEGRSVYAGVRLGRGG